MQGPADIWRLAADSFEATVGRISDDQWELPTDCGEWTVRELVDHALFWQSNLARTVGADVSPEDGWPAIKSAIAGQLEDPSVLDGTIESGPTAGLPKHMGMGLATADVLVHGWDIARAIGADDTLPAAAVEAVHMGLSQAPEALLRNPQVFGPAVEVPDDASAQDKLIAFVGRRP